MLSPSSHRSLPKVLGSHPGHVALEVWVALLSPVAAPQVLATWVSPPGVTWPLTGIETSHRAKEGGRDFETLSGDSRHSATSLCWTYKK